MFITCPNCKKKFKIDLSLIPIDGRDLKCGSCEHIWFYKKEDKKTDILSSILLSISSSIFLSLKLPIKGAGFGLLSSNLKNQIWLHKPHFTSLPLSGIKEGLILNCLLQLGQLIIMIIYISDLYQISFNFDLFIL